VFGIVRTGQTITQVDEDELDADLAALVAASEQEDADADGVGELPDVPVHFPKVPVGPMPDLTDPATEPAAAESPALVPA
jgi:hypothetical protein